MKGLVRSLSACILLAYVVVHLLNHALVLVSLRAADAALELLPAVWRSWPATLLLGAACALARALEELNRTLAGQGEALLRGRERPLEVFVLPRLP